MNNSNLKTLFFKSMKNKPFFSNFKKFIRKEPVDSVNVSICLSSLLTHCLIEMRSNIDAYHYLQISEQALILHWLTDGKTTIDVIRDFYIELYGDADE